MAMCMGETCTPQKRMLSIRDFKASGLPVQFWPMARRRSVLAFRPKTTESPWVAMSCNLLVSKDPCFTPCVCCLYILAAWLPTFFKLGCPEFAAGWVACWGEWEGGQSGQCRCSSSPNDVMVVLATRSHKQLYTMTGDGWNPTHKGGDDLGIVYDIGFTTLL